MEVLERIDAFAAALEQGQRRGIVREDVDPQMVAAFVVAAVEGSIELASTAGDPAVMRSNLEVLDAFLEGLRRPAVLETSSSPADAW